MDLNMLIFSIVKKIKREIENFILKILPFLSPTIIIKVRKISTASGTIT
jgi:hypothetical protein